MQRVAPLTAVVCKEVGAPHALLRPAGLLAGLQAAADALHQPLHGAAGVRGAADLDLGFATGGGHVL